MVQPKIIIILIIFSLALSFPTIAEDSIRKGKETSAKELAKLKKIGEELTKKNKLETIVVPHMNASFKIDGGIDEGYKKAAKISLNRNDSGPKDIAEKYLTEIYLMTNSKFLYILFKCKEPSLDPKTFMKEELVHKNFEKIFKRMSKLKIRDQAMWDDFTWEDAYVEFLLEPGGEREVDGYYHIAANTNGTLYDASNRDEINWDPKILTGTKHHEGYYVIELAIPLNELVSSEKKFPKIWSGNFFRLRHKVGEMAWSKSWKTHMPKKFGNIIFAIGEEKK